MVNQNLIRVEHQPQDSRAWVEQYDEIYCAAAWLRWSCACVRTKREPALNQEEVSLLDAQRKSKAQRKIKAKTILLENSQHQSATISQNDALSLSTRLGWCDGEWSIRGDGSHCWLWVGWIHLEWRGKSTTAFFQTHLQCRLNFCLLGQVKI